jgi:large subunit ribosomal protein L18
LARKKDQDFLYFDLTLIANSSLNTSSKKEKISKTDAAALVGEELAKKALSKKIKKVSFDRSGYKYNGRIKALAEAARKGGLIF